jgi:hypothetical protein
MRDGRYATPGHKLNLGLTDYDGVAVDADSIARRARRQADVQPLVLTSEVATSVAILKSLLRHRPLG